MEDNTSIEPVEISESQKNIEQTAGIWGAIKSIWYTISCALDRLAPVSFGGIMLLVAIYAYFNTLNDAKLELSAGMIYILIYSCAWTLIIMPLRKSFGIVLEQFEV